MAATESMILTSEWCMAELLRQPALLQKAQAELSTEIAPPRPLRESDLPRLPFLHALIKETFRLHPAAPLLMPRESSHPSSAFGYHFPSQTRVLVNVWAIGRDPAVWPEPLAFKPERFLEGDKRGVDVKGQHFELLAFGSGRRVCPAVSMGMVVVGLVVGSLLQAFEWGLPEGVGVKDVDMSELFGLTLPRKEKLECVAKPRLPAWCYEDPSNKAIA